MRDVKDVHSGAGVILYAEDDPDDAFFFEKAVERAALPHTIALVDDGQGAVDWIAGKGKYADRAKYPMPVVLVLDLKMPRKSGLEVLKWVREQKHLADLPVVILSSSGEASDIKQAMELGATRYFVKTAPSQDVVQFLGVIC